MQHFSSHRFQASWQLCKRTYSWRHKQIFINMTPQNQNACKKLHCFQGCAVRLWNYNDAAYTTWFYKAATRKVMFRHKAWTLLPWRRDAILRSVQQWYLVTSSKINYLLSHSSVIGNLNNPFIKKNFFYFPSFQAVAYVFADVAPHAPSPHGQDKTCIFVLNICYSKIVFTV